MLNPDFSSYPLPEWSSPQVIANAMSGANAATDLASARAASSNLLYAVGNDHAGTYYPAAPALVQALLPLLTTDNMWARRAALETVVDLCGSFRPEPGFEFMVLADGLKRSTAEMLREALQRLAPALRSIQDQSKDKMERELILEILTDSESAQ